MCITHPIEENKYPSKIRLHKRMERLNIHNAEEKYFEFAKACVT